MTDRVWKWDQTDWPILDFQWRVKARQSPAFSGLLIEEGPIDFKHLSVLRDQVSVRIDTEVSTEFKAFLDEQMAHFWDVRSQHELILLRCQTSNSAGNAECLSRASF